MIRIRDLVIIVLCFLFVGVAVVFAADTVATDTDTENPCQEQIDNAYEQGQADASDENDDDNIAFVMGTKIIIPNLDFNGKQYYVIMIFDAQTGQFQLKSN